jgi:hypothetical protein
MRREKTPSAEERPTAGSHGFRHLGRTLRGFLRQSWRAGPNAA